MMRISVGERDRSLGTKLAIKALGGPAPVRGFLPYLMDLVLKREINPGKVFDLELSLADVAEGYLAMDKRRAVKTLLRV